MRKLLALVVACWCLLTAGVAQAASYGACCADECAVMHCAAPACQACVSPALPTTDAGRVARPAPQAVPPWTPPARLDARHAVWRPPD